LSKSIQEALYEKGYTLFIVSTNDDKNMELKLIRDLILRSVDALIIAPCNKVTELKPIIDESPIPVVWVDRIGDEFADFVGINNYQEATLLVKKFSKKPAKIGILKPEQSNVMTIQLRIDGAKTACDKEHIPYLEASIKDFSDQSVAQIQQLLDAGVDSFLALNNRVALNTVNILKKLNVSIPTQARIISFDDSVAFPYFHPAITALSQPVDEIGKESAERVLKRLKESSENRKHLMLECTFIERGSH
jgi:LacI family transcriptional regulator